MTKNLRAICKFTTFKSYLKIGIFNNRLNESKNYIPLANKKEAIKFLINSTTKEIYIIFVYKLNKGERGEN